MDGCTATRDVEAAISVNETPTHSIEAIRQEFYFLSFEAICREVQRLQDSGRVALSAGQRKTAGKCGSNGRCAQNVERSKCRG